MHLATAEERMSFLGQTVNAHDELKNTFNLEILSVFISCAKAEKEIMHFHFSHQSAVAVWAFWKLEMKGLMQKLSHLA